MAFLCLAPAVDLIRICGRGVSGVDFGHSKNGDFEGVYALGVHQTGEGKLIPVWAACFGGASAAESNWTWEQCAMAIQEAALGDLYGKGYTNFTDRAKGAVS